MTRNTCRPKWPARCTRRRRSSNDRRSRACRAVARRRARARCSWCWRRSALARGRRRRDARAVRPVAVVQGAARRCSRWLLLITRVPRLRHVGAAGRREQPFGQAEALQGRRRVGEPRRLDAALGDDPRRSPAARWRCSSGGCAERTLIATLGAQAAIALGFYAFLLFASNPFARLDPGAGRRAGAQPAAAGPRLGVPPADALPRLCRPLGRVLASRSARW